MKLSSPPEVLEKIVSSHSYKAGLPQEDRGRAPVPHMGIAARKNIPRQHSGETNTTYASSISFLNGEPLNTDSFKKREETPSGQKYVRSLGLSSQQNPRPDKAANKFLCKADDGFQEVARRKTETQRENPPIQDKSSEIKTEPPLKAPSPKPSRRSAERIVSEPESVSAHRASSQRKQTKLKTLWKVIKGWVIHRFRSRKTHSETQNQTIAELRRQVEELKDAISKQLVFGNAMQLRHAASFSLAQKKILDGLKEQVDELKKKNAILEEQVFGRVMPSGRTANSANPALARQQITAFPSQEPTRFKEAELARQVAKQTEELTALRARVEYWKGIEEVISSKNTGVIAA